MVLVLYVFSYPTSPPRSCIGLVLCVPSYTLSSSSFKGVTGRMSFKHTSFPLCYPWYMQVQAGAWSKPINTYALLMTLFSTKTHGSNLQLKKYHIFMPLSDSNITRTLCLETDTSLHFHSKRQSPFSPPPPQKKGLHPNIKLLKIFVY